MKGMTKKVSKRQGKREDEGKRRCLRGRLRGKLKGNSVGLLRSSGGKAEAGKSLKRSLRGRLGGG